MSQTREANKILINGSFPEQIRVAEINKGQLRDYQMETAHQPSIQENIYLGRVEHVADQLDSAFIDIGMSLNGFLPMKYISQELLNQGGREENTELRLNQILSPGDEIIVQIRVDKRVQEGKGAMLSNIINLPGSFVTLLPNGPPQGNSQIIVPRHMRGEHKAELREQLQQLNVPAGMNLIVLGTGIHAPLSELQTELDALVDQWHRIQLAASNSGAPRLLMRRQELLLRILRERLNEKVSEVIVDDPAIYEQARNWVRHIRPEEEHKVQLYSASVPLFTRYNIEDQVALLYSRRVKLPSGGSIVLDNTEALTSIDVNSGRSDGGDVEQTAVLTNDEALEEIARQLQLRNIGGQIVIDLIHMSEAENRTKLVTKFQQRLGKSPGDLKVASINEFGLLCLTRKRIEKSLWDHALVNCPECEGQGLTPTMQTQAHFVLRAIEAEAASAEAEITQFHVLVPVQAGISLANEMRGTIALLEKRHGVEIIVIPITSLRWPQYDIRGQRSRVPIRGAIRNQQSHQEYQETKGQLEQTHRETAAVANIPDYDKFRRKPSLWQLLKELLSGSDKNKKAKPHGDSRQAKPRRTGSGGRRREDQGGRRTAKAQQTSESRRGSRASTERAAGKNQKTHRQARADSRPQAGRTQRSAGAGKTDSPSARGQQNRPTSKDRHSDGERRRSPRQDPAGNGSIRSTEGPPPSARRNSAQSPVSRSTPAESERNSDSAPTEQQSRQNAGQRRGSMLHRRRQRDDDPRQPRNSGPAAAAKVAASEEREPPHRRPSPDRQQRNEQSHEAESPRRRPSPSLQQRNEQSPESETARRSSPSRQQRNEQSHEAETSPRPSPNRQQRNEQSPETEPQQRAAPTPKPTTASTVDKERSEALQKEVNSWLDRQ